MKSPISTVAIVASAFCGSSFANAEKTEASSTFDKSHWLLVSMDHTGALLDLFASNVDLGVTDYEKCPLAFSFYREGVVWRVNDQFGEENLIRYLSGMRLDANRIVSFLRVVNAMDFTKKRELLKKWNVSIPADDPRRAKKFICPRMTKENKWEWVSMTLDTFFKEVTDRTP